MLQKRRKGDATRLMFLGSSCIYPRLAPQPLKEEYLLTGPLEPTKQAKAPTVGVWGTGTPLREFMYSEDMADACIYLMNLPDETFNTLLGSDEAATGVKTSQLGNWPKPCEMSSAIKGTSNSTAPSPTAHRAS